MTEHLSGNHKPKTGKYISYFLLFMLDFYLIAQKYILKVIKILYTKQSLNLCALTTVAVCAQGRKHRALTSGDIGIL